MAAYRILHFPSFSGICSCKCKHHNNQYLHHFLGRTSREILTPLHLVAISALSPKNFGSRIRRKVKSNVELYNEIREFVIDAGFPEGHVPSMKDLLEHGRDDLAYIVRRRGYKFIRDLLANSTDPDSESGTDVEFLDGGKEVLPKNSLADMSETMVEYESPTKNLFSMENSLPELEDFSVNLDVEEETPNKSSMDLSLKEKVAKFIQSGYLDAVEDGIDGTLDESGDETAESHEEEVIEEVESQSGENHVEDELSGDHVGATLVMRDDDLSSQTQIAITDSDSQPEISRLRFMLRQKELELSRLKEHILKENLALTLLQAKSETEINNAKKFILDKDSELYTAEESLSGLEEVKIQYCGDGEIVEITGSFNGWHHRIKMDPELSSSIEDPNESRKSRIWSTVLWLYPGVYEIKFIVDGNWRADPQRESVMKHGICNNILRVKRGPDMTVDSLG